MEREREIKTERVRGRGRESKTERQREGEMDGHTLYPCFKTIPAAGLPNICLSLPTIEIVFFSYILKRR